MLNSSNGALDRKYDCFQLAIACAYSPMSKCRLPSSYSAAASAAFAPSSGAGAGGAAGGDREALARHAVADAGERLVIAGRQRERGASVDQGDRLTVDRELR